MFEALLNPKFATKLFDIVEAASSPSTFERLVAICCPEAAKSEDDVSVLTTCSAFESP